MKQGVKIILIIGFIVVFFVLFGLIVGTREASGHQTPGVLGLILLVGLIAGIRAIWKYNPEKSSEILKKEQDNHLDKSL